jgi:hypothetical protein
VKKVGNCVGVAQSYEDVSWGRSQFYLKFLIVEVTMIENSGNTDAQNWESWGSPTSA